MPFFGVPFRNGLPLGLGSIAGFGVVPFSPAQLFAAGEQGAWYDPSDFSTMFQDSAGTTPVTAVEQPVGLILDKSGRGNHASQATSAARPVLKQDSSGRYNLLFDGLNSSLSTASINFTGTDEMTWFLGTRRLGTTATQMILELSASSGSTNGSFALVASSIYSFATRGTTERYANSGAYTNPITHVLTGMSDISADNMVLRINGSQIAQTALDLGTGNFSNNPLFIGARNNASLRYNGAIYSIIVRNVTTSAILISQTETWVNGVTGAY